MFFDLASGCCVTSGHAPVRRRVFMDESFERRRFSADLEGGRHVELEMPDDNTAWMAVGSGIDLTDVWGKEVGGLADLRIRIKRVSLGIEVSIDRGEQSDRWWRSGEVPQLKVAIDSGEASVS